MEPDYLPPTTLAEYLRLAAQPVPTAPQPQRFSSPNGIYGGMGQEPPAAPFGMQLPSMLEGGGAPALPSPLKNPQAAGQGGKGSPTTTDSGGKPVPLPTQAAPSLLQQSGDVGMGPTGPPPGALPMTIQNGAVVNRFQNVPQAGGGYQTQAAALNLAGAPVDWVPIQSQGDAAAAQKDPRFNMAMSPKEALAAYVAQSAPAGGQGLMPFEDFNKQMYSGTIGPRFYQPLAEKQQIMEAYLGMQRARAAAEHAAAETTKAKAFAEQVTHDKSRDKLLGDVFKGLTFQGVNTEDLPDVKKALVDFLSKETPGTTNLPPVSTDPGALATAGGVPASDVTKTFEKWLGDVTNPADPNSKARKGARVLRNAGATGKPPTIYDLVRMMESSSGLTPRQIQANLKKVIWPQLSKLYTPDEIQGFLDKPTSDYMGGPLSGLPYWVTGGYKDETAKRREYRKMLAK